MLAAALLTIPPLIFAAIGDLTLLQVRRSDILTSNRSVAQSVSGLIDASIDEAVSVAWATSAAPSTVGLSPTILNLRLGQLSPIYPQFENIIVVDLAGHVVGRMRPVSGGLAQNLIERAEVRAAIAKNLAQVSPTLVVLPNGARVGSVAVPIRDDAGTPIGAVVVENNLDYLSARLEGITATPGRIIAVTDASGQTAFVINSPSGSQPPTSLANAPLISQALASGASEQLEGPLGPYGGDWLGVALKTPQYGWVVAAIEPVSVATEPVRDLVLLDLMGLVIVIGLAIAGSYYVARQILRPIRALAMAASEFSRGNLHERVDIHTGDEFETLATAFNSMAGSLSQTITRLNETDRRLASERNRLQAILNTSPAGIVAIDRSERIIIANPAAEIIGGTSITNGQKFSELEGMNRLSKPDGSPFSYSELPIVRALWTGAIVAGVEIVLRRPNGWEQHLLTNAAPIRDANDEIVGAVAVFFDVTPLVEEERLRTEFVLSAAHEFRNPLTVIKGYAEIAMRDPIVQGSSVYRELSRILDAANRVERLADQLMRSAQLHLPALVLRTEVVDLAALVSETVRRFASTGHGKGYEFDVQTLPAQVEGDPVLLAEAVTDLLEQAVSVTPPGGKIKVCVSTWDGIATTSVTDQGPRITSEELSSIFTPFVVVTGAGEKVERGRPHLLLYLVRRIIEESGGWVRAESNETETTISFTLPRYPPHDQNGVSDRETTGEVARTPSQLAARTDASDESRG